MVMLAVAGCVIFVLLLQLIIELGVANVTMVAHVVPF